MYCDTVLTKHQTGGDPMGPFEHDLPTTSSITELDRRINEYMRLYADSAIRMESLRRLGIVLHDADAQGRPHT